MAKRDTSPQQSAENHLTGVDGELKQPVHVPTAGSRSATYADKKRDRFRPHSPELHFTTSLYLDRAIALLHEQAQKASDRLDSPEIRCEVIPIDSDRARFKLESLRMGMTTGRLEGTMQRWQGSLVRVDVRVRYFTNDGANGSGAVVGSILFLLVLGVLGAQILGMWALGVPPEKSVFPLVVLTSVWGLVAVAFLEGIRQSFFGKVRVTHAMAKRDVDDLTAILTGVFGQYDLQWLDKSG